MIKSRRKRKRRMGQALSCLFSTFSRPSDTQVHFESKDTSGDNIHKHKNKTNYLKANCLQILSMSSSSNLYRPGLVLSSSM